MSYLFARNAGLASDWRSACPTALCCSSFAGHVDRVIGMGSAAGACALTRFMRTLLYGVQASDPLTFAAIAGT